MLSQTQATLCVISTHVGTQLVLSCSQQVSHLALFHYPKLLKEEALIELGFCKFKASLLLGGSISSVFPITEDWLESMWNGDSTRLHGFSLLKIIRKGCRKMLNPQLPYLMYLWYQDAKTLGSVIYYIFKTKTLTLVFPKSNALPCLTCYLAIKIQWSV